MNAMPLRSVLYMPAINQRAMDKARGLPADAIIFDLEDAVAPDVKDSARGQVVAQLAAGGYGERQLVVRCNSLATPWGEQDIRALGFDGKTLIHPSQIAVANEVFGLSDAAVERATRVLEVWREAEQAGKGVAVLDGKLVETMYVDEARRTLAMAQQIARLREVQ